MSDKKLTEELLNELLDAPNIDGYIKEHDFAAPSLSNYLKQLLQEKGLERSRVVRMADLNETFGYQIFTGARHPSRNKAVSYTHLDVYKRQILGRCSKRLPAR